MSEQINPIVSDEDINSDGKLRKWSTGRKVKWIIWIVIIIAVALGFWHQYYMRSDSSIKTVFNDNKQTFQTVADFMLGGMTDENARLKKGKRSIGALGRDDSLKDIKTQIEELERRNIAYIECDGTKVIFYTIYDSYYVYFSPLSSTYSGNDLGGGWAYVKTSKS